MKKENSNQILKRIVVTSILLQIISFLVIFIFTKRLIYSIISLLAATISFAGFILMIKLIDKILKTKKGNGLFFLFGFFKMVVIALVFYPISKISDIAVVIYIYGLSTIILAIMVEGGYQLFKKQYHGT